ncbi:MAG: GTPase, partial [Phycisphaerales bacterium]
GAWAHDQLFATLSTRVERWELGGGTGVMLSDTVGFIRRLPHHLIASFKSTLEETTHCQLLLLVLDASDPNALSQLDTVQATLDDIDARHQPRLLLL